MGCSGKESSSPEMVSRASLACGFSSSDPLRPLLLLPLERPAAVAVPVPASTQNTKAPVCWT